jgi:hypothetical protein
MSEEPRLRSITSNSEFRMRLSSCLNRLESCLRRKSASISCLVLGIRMRTQQQRMITATTTNRVISKIFFKYYLSCKFTDG